MSFLRGSSHKTQAPAYTGLQLQTSSNALPIPVMWGVARLAPNIIATGNFHSYPASSGGKKHGKGGLFGGGGGGSSNGYDYTAGFILGLCEGQIYGIGGVWDNQSTPHWTAPQSWNGQANTGLGAIGYNLQSGSTPQYPVFLFSYQNALSYPGLAYVYNYSMELGSSPSLPSLTFEVYSARQFASPILGGYDADPALVIQDFLTNSQYGVGFPSGSISAATLLGASGGASYQAYCKASGFAMSPALINSESASSILQRWLSLTNSAAIWSGGLLKFIPYGETAVTGTYAFTPNVTPAYALTDNDYVHEDGNDPVEVHRTDPFTAKNWVSIEFLDKWGNSYAPVPVDVWDQSAIELYGLHKGSTITAHEFTQSGAAQVSAQLALQRGLQIRNTYSFKLSFEYCLLEPMDLVTLTDTGLGMNGVTVRITAIEEDDSGILSITAEDFTGLASSAVAYPVSGGSGAQFATNQGVVPAPVNAPVIFEPPPSLTGNTAQVWVAASGALPAVYKLAETSATGQHSAQWSGPSGGSIGDSAKFVVYVKAVERAFATILAFDGSATWQCDFDLSGLTASPAIGATFTTATIETDSSGFLILTVAMPLAAAAVPAFRLVSASALGTISYAGTVGSGIYAWGAEASVGGESLSMLAGGPSLVNATYSLTAAVTPEGAAGSADPNWGGAYVWASIDAASYSQIGQITAPARMGVMTASLAAFAGSNPDSAHTLAVDLSMSGGTLQSVTGAEASNADTLCYAGGELLSFQNATLTGGAAYNLTTLYRGLYGTSAAAHAAGAPFARLDNAVLNYNLPTAWIGVPIYLKFQSYNVFGNALQDISESAVFSYTPVGSGALGAISQALLVGTSLDFGLASAAVTSTDDWGLASDPLATPIDLGLASS